VRVISEQALSLEILWIEEGHILYIHVPEVMTTEVMDLINRRIIYLIETTHTTKELHIVVDQSDLRQFPLNLITYSHELTWLKHPRLGWLATFGNTNPILAFAVATITKFAGIRFYRADSQEDAVRFLRTTAKKVEPTSST
jgi:hypothetical protein